MAPADDVIKKIKEMPREKIDTIIKALAGELDKEMQVRERDAPELYGLLHKDVQRWLTQLGHDENKEVLTFLLRLNKEKIEKLDAMLDGFGEAQRLGKLVRVLWWGLVAMLGATWSFVKVLPDGLEWIRMHLK